MLCEFRRSLANTTAVTPTPVHSVQTVETAYGRPNANITRTMLGWNLRFSGARDDIPIERFIVRVDQMAHSSGVNLTNAVSSLTCLLSGAALEWFWTILERDPELNWTTLKREMLQRFSRGLTNREIRRMLDSRKQKYPHESYGEFQDAILQISLQAATPISDAEVLEILLNNIRPGLQLALAGKPINNIGQLAQEARALENLWKQIRHNPESGVTPFRSHLNEIDEHSSTNQDVPSDPNMVCAFNNTNWRSRTTKIPTTSQTAYRCWNCEATGHNYQLCRQARKVFCYGCGLPDTYLPDCPRCQKVESGNPQTRENQVRGTLSRPITSPRILNRTDSASNTDPELYQRHTRPQPHM